jgi:hypothetical protein
MRGRCDTIVVWEKINMSLLPELGLMGALGLQRCRMPRVWALPDMMATAMLFIGFPK